MVVTHSITISIFSIDWCLANAHVFDVWAPLHSGASFWCQRWRQDCIQNDVLTLTIDQAPSPQIVGFLSITLYTQVSSFFSLWSYYCNLTYFNTCYWKGWKLIKLIHLSISLSVHSNLAMIRNNLLYYLNLLSLRFSLLYNFIWK